MSDRESVATHPWAVIRSSKEPMRERVIAASVWLIIEGLRAAFAIIPAYLYYTYSFEVAVIGGICLAIFVAQDGVSEMVKNGGS